MSPSTPIRMSASKAEFFQRLGLEEDDRRGTAIYELLKREAVAGYERLKADKGNLTEQSRRENVAEPSSWDQVTETARHREILRIVETASDITRPYYEKGRYRDGQNEENWVARWCLWHVFRYRDGRNRSSGGGNPFGSPQRNAHHDHRRFAAAEAGDNASGYWDPIREL